MSGTVDGGRSFFGRGDEAGDGSFLPVEVGALACADLGEDGLDDVILLGNDAGRDWVYQRRQR